MAETTPLWIIFQYLSDKFHFNYWLIGHFLSPKTWLACTEWLICFHRPTSNLSRISFKCILTHIRYLFCSHRISATACSRMYFINGLMTKKVCSSPSHIILFCWRGKNKSVCIYKHVIYNYIIEICYVSKVLAHS